MAPSNPTVPPLSALLVPTEEPLRRLWGPITIRVAWELTRRGVNPRPATLRAAREHALWRMPPGADLAEAEARVGFAVDEYCRRLHGDYRPALVDPDVTLLPDPRWRDTVLGSLEPLQEAIFRLHYGDGEPFGPLVERLGVRPVQARAAREALRECVREVVGAGGLSTEGWDQARVDRLIERVANAAGDACPGPGGLATDVGRSHADGCPRCSRALRLIREGLLSPSDLFTPDHEPCLPEPDLDLVVVAVHPDARGRKLLNSSLGEVGILLDEGLWALPGPEAEPRLSALTEVNRPPASQLRGVRRVVAGRWGRALTGVGVDALIQDVRGLAWGELRGFGPLKEGEAGPPSPIRWWAAAVLALAITTALGIFVLRSPARGDVDLRAEARTGAVAFWAEPGSYVDVVSVAPFAVVFHSGSPADKGTLARPDGSYELATVAGSWLVVAGSTPLDDLPQIVGAATSVSDLQARIRARYPAATVVRVP